MPDIPDVDRLTLERALERFDRDYRDGSDWVGWEERAAYKFAIEHNGRRYPEASQHERPPAPPAPLGAAISMT